MRDGNIQVIRPVFGRRWGKARLSMLTEFIAKHLAARARFLLLTIPSNQASVRLNMTRCDRLHLVLKLIGD